jgi:hypothetical protein
VGANSDAFDMVMLRRTCERRLGPGSFAQTLRAWNVVGAVDIQKFLPRHRVLPLLGRKRSLGEMFKAVHGGSMEAAGIVAHRAAGDVEAMVRIIEASTAVRRAFSELPCGTPVGAWSEHVDRLDARREWRQTMDREAEAERSVSGPEPHRGAEAATLPGDGRPGARGAKAGSGEVGRFEARRRDIEQGGADAGCVDPKGDGLARALEERRSLETELAALTIQTAFRSAAALVRRARAARRRVRSRSDKGSRRPCAFWFSAFAQQQRAPVADLAPGARSRIRAPRMELDTGRHTGDWLALPG